MTGMSWRTGVRLDKLGSRCNRESHINIDTCCQGEDLVG